MDEDKFYELSELYKKPKHKKIMKDATYMYQNFSISCGDKFSVYIKTEGSTIKDASFDGNGCVISTVAVSKLCDYLIGKDISIIQKMGIADIENLLQIGHISSSRVGCAMVGLNAFKKAIDEKPSKK